MRIKVAGVGVVCFLGAVLAGLTPERGLCAESGIAQEISLSRREAIEAAFSNNKDLQIQVQEVEAKKAVLGEAKSRFWPQITASAGYTRNETVLSLPATAGSNPKKDSKIYTGYKHDLKAGLEIDQTFYNGGYDYANFKTSELELKVQEETLRAKKLDIKQETERLYNGLLYAKETERIARELLKQSESHYADVLRKFKEGTSSRFDVLQSKVQVSKVIPELLDARNSVDAIATDLKKLLGLDLHKQLALEDKLEHSPLALDERFFLKEAYLDRPEMTLKALGVDIGEWSIKMARSGALPDVRGTASVNLRSNRTDSLFEKEHENWSAGVVVSLPLFDGFATKAKVDEAKARYSQALLDRENFTDQIAVDIHKACLDLKQAEELIRSQKDSVGEAQEALRISILSYENGMGTNLDILDSQVSLAEVEMNLASGVYDYLTAEAFLNRSRGKETSEDMSNEE